MITELFICSTWIITRICIKLFISLLTICILLLFILGTSYNIYSKTKDKYISKITPEKQLKMMKSYMKY